MCQIICISLQTDNHASSTTSLDFLQAGCPSCHPTITQRSVYRYFTKRLPEQHRGSATIVQKSKVCKNNLEQCKMILAKFSILEYNLDANCESLLIRWHTERRLPIMKTDCCLLSTVRTRQDIKLHPCFTIHCHYYMTVDDKVKQHGALWWIGWKIWLFASAWCRRRYCQRHAPYGPSWENMTSSTKPQIHNVFQCRQSRTEPWSQVTFAEKFRAVWTWFLANVNSRSHSLFAVARPSVCRL